MEELLEADEFEVVEGRRPFDVDSYRSKLNSEVVSVTSFTEYQRKMWYALSQGAVSRFYHERNPVHGEYKIKKIGWIPLTFYWFMWINTTIKVLVDKWLITYKIQNASFLGWIPSANLSGMVGSRGSLFGSNVHIF